MWVYVYSGLTSRCITLAHAYNLCVRQHQKLTIVWPLDERCNISYHEIFDQESFPGIQIRVMEMKCRGPEVGPIKSLRRRMYLQAVKDTFIKLKKALSLLPVKMVILYYHFQGNYIDYNPPKEIGWSGEKFDEFTQKTWSLAYNRISLGKEVFIHAYCGMIQGEEGKTVKLNCINFKKGYYEIVERIMSQKKEWVGVHIRRTDHVAAICHSSLDSFIKRMKEVTGKRPEVSFFLATDDEQVEKRMKDEFPNQIVVQDDKAWGRNSEAGMKAGIIDCLCLSRCEYILGSYTSVFSEFAAQYGGKRLYICQDEGEE